MVRKAFLIVTLLHLLVAVAPAQERLAVLDTVLPEGIDRQVVIPITEKIMEEFVQSKLFIVVDRSFIAKSLSEMEFNLSDLVASDEKLSEFGGFLKATYIVVSTVQRLDTRYFISAKMIEVKTGVIIAQASADKDGNSAVLIDMAGAVGEKLVLSAMGKPVAPKASETVKAEPKKVKLPALSLKMTDTEAFASVGFFAGASLATVEVDDGSSGYDYFSLYRLDLYDAETVDGFSLGLDARYPFSRYFYAGLALGYSEYSFYGTYYEDLYSYDFEAFASFTELAGLIGLSYTVGAFQPYIGLGMAVLVGNGEYIDSYGDLLDDCEWTGLPFGFEIGLDYRFGKRYFAGLRFSSFSGFITSDSGDLDSDYHASSFMLRLGIAF